MKKVIEPREGVELIGKPAKVRRENPEEICSKRVEEVSRICRDMKKRERRANSTKNKKRNCREQKRKNN